ncbi:hypothetical protein [Nocardia transvalensis]|uniref:hypothetical protein n=1 Tax=Nocardia transvalensis TaxID=37333 RepID=UPI001895F63D|nr:hypothetical protein [Nocardia transvalensis]MBF6328513.1 hypothetical protein [Nocardia transvalensis]
MQAGTEEEVRKRVRYGDDSEMSSEGVTIRLSGEAEIMADGHGGLLYMPTWLELRLHGYDEPDTFARVELRDGIPRLVELSWKAGSGQSEVRQKHLRETDVSIVVEDLYPGFVFYVDPEAQTVYSPAPPPDGGESLVYLVNRKLIEQRRTGNRRITTALLEQVAEVYRSNIDHAPTAAVARVFGVKSSMASRYVAEARKRGFLPPTKQGKKNA